MGRRRVLVSAWIGSENLGDELLFACLKRRLAELGVVVEAVSKDPTSTERLHGVHAVHHYDYAGVSRALLRCDGLVFGGGGLLQDGTSVLSLPYHLSRIVLAKALRVPFIGLGLGVGPIRLRASPWMLRGALTGHRGLTVRDEASATTLRQYGVTDVRVTSDMVFSLEPPRVPPGNQINLALRSYRDGLIPERYRLNPADDGLESTLARALDEVARRTRLHLRFLAFEGMRDELFNRRVAAQMATKDVSFASLQLGNVMDEMARGRMTIAMRYHGGVTSIVAERPVVLIGYAPKVTALANELGDNCKYIAHDPDAIATLPSLVDSLLGRPAQLGSARQRLQHLEQGNAELLESFVRGLPAVPERQSSAVPLNPRAP
jgi:polysaccharide pyruvyl transferase CsaB